MHEWVRVRGRLGLMVPTDFLPSEPREIYSPGQVAAGTFFGGPIASVYFLHANFVGLDKNELANRTALYGCFFVASLLGVLPFLPDWFPNMLIPLLNVFAASHIATTHQMTRAQIGVSDRFTFRSKWRVAWISLGMLMIFVALAVVVLVVMDVFGIVSLE